MGQRRFNHHYDGPDHDDHYSHDHYGPDNHPHDDKHDNYRARDNDYCQQR